jgi:hypothetical protein
MVGAARVRSLVVMLLGALGPGCAAHMALRPAEAVHDAEVLGRALFEQDRVSAVATDAMRAAGGFEAKRDRAGWVTLRTPDGWRVSFLARERGQPVVVAEVLFERGEPGEGFPVLPGQPLLVTPRPVSDRPLDPEELSAYLALRTAAANPFPRCARTYNPVVLPASLVGLEGLLVYLLPAQMTVTSWPFAVQRFHVTASGTHLQDRVALTRSCITLEWEQGSKEVLFVTHLLSDTPLEHHVLASLATGLELMVMTPDGGLWSITGGKVERDAKEPPRRQAVPPRGAQDPAAGSADTGR